MLIEKLAFLGNRHVWYIKTKSQNLNYPNTDYSLHKQTRACEVTTSTRWGYCMCENTQYYGLIDHPSQPHTNISHLFAP